MTERIGIMLEKRLEDGHFLGQLVSLDISVKLNEKGCIEVCREIKRVGFNLNPIEQIFYAFTGTDFEVAKEIAIELKKIGFEDIKFDFYEDVYNAEGEEI